MSARIPVLLCCFLLVLVVPATLVAQEPPLNMSLVSNFDQPGQSYGDVWGDGNYAYISHFGQPRVDIIDISNPSAPQLAATYTGLGSAQDVKVANGLMFVGQESASPGVHIVDVRDPTNPTKLTNVTVLNAVHNTFYHEGWLYIVDSARALIEIVDLRTYDPDNAPATISSSKWTINNVGAFVHDITVQGDYLFASAWSGIRVYDITNIANQKPPFLAGAAGSAVHSAWATDDLEYLVVAEERFGGGLSLYEMVGGTEGAALSLVKRDTFNISTSRAVSAHNPVVSGYTVYTSWYQVGVQVLEIDPVLKKFSLVASYDTTAASGSGSFAGCWGVYPFLGDDRILASDTSTGLWVLEADLESSFSLSLTGSCPGTVTVDVTGAAPNSEIGIVSAAGNSGFTKGGNACNGTLFEVSEPFVLPPTFLISNGSGTGSTTMNLQSGRCWVEALDWTTCQTTPIQSPNQ